MNKIICLFILSMCVFISSAWANEHDKSAHDEKKQEMMKKFEAAATPGPNHKMLAEKAGTWSYTSKMWESPNAKPHESKGTTIFNSILGGRWLQQSFAGEAMGQKFEGMGLVGYDNVKEKFQSVWIDTMGTGVMLSDGTYDAKKKTIKEKGSMSCPLSAGKMQEFRSDWQMTSKNKMIFTMFGKGPTEGPEFKMMEITYTR